MSGSVQMKGYCFYKETPAPFQTVCNCLLQRWPRMRTHLQQVASAAWGNEFSLRQHYLLLPSRTSSRKWLSVQSSRVALPAVSSFDLPGLSPQCEMCVMDVTENKVEEKPSVFTISQDSEWRRETVGGQGAGHKDTFRSIVCVWAV